MTEETKVVVADLEEAARLAATRAYAPYSGFRVGAALLLTNGAVVCGANVENLSFGLTICAERSALVSAVAQFGPDVRVARAVVVNLNESPSAPCGACRQVLSEFMDAEATVSFPAETAAGIAQATMTMGELLPVALRLKLGAR